MTTRRGLDKTAWALGAAALAARFALCLAAARAVGAPPRDLSLFYDGHLYLIVAKTFPRLYVRIPELFPMYRDGAYLANRYPFYPLLIRLAGAPFGDLRLGALLVSQLAGALTVLVAYRLAQGITPRPHLPALLLCFFPPTWLLTSTLAFTESVFVCLLTASLLLFLRRKAWPSATLAGLAAVTQKSGFLMPLFLLALTARRHGVKDPGKLAPYLFGFAPFLALHAYLYLVFGEPLVDVRVEREVFAGPFFSFPFHALLAGLAAPGQIFQGHFWLRKAAIALSCSFYVGILAAAWRRRTQTSEPLTLWLGLVLLFNLSLNGMWAYLAFPRFMTAAAPAAVILLAQAAPMKRNVAWLALAAPLCVGAAVLDIRSAVELGLRWWGRDYFWSLLHLLPK